jgi:hypothetical protein
MKCGDRNMASSPPELVYVYLPESLMPLDRGDKYEEPIIEELERLGLGEVSGAGSSLGDPQPDGTRLIEYCGIDVDTDHVDATRDALRALLPKLGCPAGTQLHYRADETPLQDEYDGSGWALDQHRSMLHPGFGI